MSILEKIRKSQATINVFFATIVIIPFQVVLLGYPLVKSLNFQTGNINLTASSYPYLVGYFVLTIVYCVLASLAFHPKRIISPINVQIGTIVVISAILFSAELMSSRIYSTSQALSIVTNVLFLSVLLAVVLGVIGFIQFLIVLWAIGLNFENVERVSFSVNTKSEEVISVLGDDFIDVWGFSRQKDNPSSKKKNIIWVLKCRDAVGNHVVLTIGSHPLDANKTVIATVTYHSTVYSIDKSKEATEMRVSIINDISGRLLSFNQQFALTKMDVVDDVVSFKAYSHALDVTCPKTQITAEFFRKIPRYYLYGISITFLALIFTTIAFIFNFLDLNTFVGAIVVLVVALFAELGVSLREELKKQEIEEID